MNELQIFQSQEFGRVRGISINNEAWLIGKDISDKLGYQNGSRDINRHVDEEDRKIITVFDGNQNRDVIVINESGLYSLVLSSHLPTAKKFKHWVTSEVLPSIRKAGGYIAGQEVMTDDELVAKALLVAQKKIEERNQRIMLLEEKVKTDKPKVLFADSVAVSDTAILIGELAKLIKQNGYDIGEKRLFQYMRDNGYLIKRRGTDYNMPTQYSMKLGLFKVKETSITHSDGHVTISKTAKVTGKGQIYFINRFKNMLEGVTSEDNA